MPANWDTFGTITVSKTNTVKAKCLTGACQVIRKTIMDDTKIEEEYKMLIIHEFISKD